MLPAADFENALRAIGSIVDRAEVLAGDENQLDSTFQTPIPDGTLQFASASRTATTADAVVDGIRLGSY